VWAQATDTRPTSSLRIRSSEPFVLRSSHPPPVSHSRRKVWRLAIEGGGCHSRIRLLAWSTLLCGGRRRRGPPGRRWVPRRTLRGHRRRASPRFRRLRGCISHPPRLPRRPPSARECGRHEHAAEATAAAAGPDVQGPGLCRGVPQGRVVAWRRVRRPSGEEAAVLRDIPAVPRGGGAPDISRSAATELRVRDLDRRPRSGERNHFFQYHFGWPSFDLVLDCRDIAEHFRI
jgi:hypothetical protein